MVIENIHGRIVGLPAHMEESGFKQARRVISISSSLMEGREPYANVSSTHSAQVLRDKILQAYPDVITDEEYYARLEVQEERVLEVEEKVEAEEKVEVATDEMTKAEIVALAKELGLEVDYTVKRKTKADLIAWVNGQV